MARQGPPLDLADRIERFGRAMTAKQSHDPRSFEDCRLQTRQEKVESLPLGSALASAFVRKRWRHGSRNSEGIPRERLPPTPQGSARPREMHFPATLLRCQPRRRWRGGDSSTSMLTDKATAPPQLRNRASTPRDRGIVLTIPCRNQSTRSYFFLRLKLRHARLPHQKAPLVCQAFLSFLFAAAATVTVAVINPQQDRFAARSRLLQARRHLALANMKTMRSLSI